jgi:hypothetical protein
MKISSNGFSDTYHRHGRVRNRKQPDFFKLCPSIVLMLKAKLHIKQAYCLISGPSEERKEIWWMVGTIFTTFQYRWASLTP